MGQKVNPISFRLVTNKNWRSKWFSERDYALLLAQDITLRKAIDAKLGRNAGVNHIEIERNPQEIVVNIHTAKPGIIIGRSGQGVIDLKNYIEKSLEKIVMPIVANLSAEKKKAITKKIKINIIEIRNPEANANLIAQTVASQLEKRVAYRRAVKMAIEKAKQHREVKGIKINVAGRLGGAEIARGEKFLDGSIPLGDLRSNVDYAFTNAFTTYGTIGIKVWVYKK